MVRASKASQIQDHGPRIGFWGRGLFTAVQWRWLLALACFPALAGLAHYLRHPGLAFHDELYTAGWIQLVHDGHWPVPAFRSGFLSNLLSAGWALLWPRQEAWLQLLPSLALGLEAVLLARFAAAQAGAHAGLAAAALTVLCAFSQLRARTLLAFTYLPLALLLLLLWLPQARRNRGWALCWGLAAGAGLLQYEAWVAALLVLSVAVLQLRREPGASWGWPALGLAAAVALIFFSWPYAQDYWAERSALNTLSPGKGLSQRLGALNVLFLGRPGAHELGRWPLWPLWALPLLAVGAWRALKQRPLLLAWALLGLLPLAASGDGFQARRAIVGLPALACIAAYALGPLLRRFPGPTAALLVLAALAEAGALDQALTERDSKAYAPSRQCAAAAKVLLRAAGPAAKTITGVGGNDPAPAAFYLAPSSEQGLPWVLVPGSYTAPSPDPLLGEWHEIRVNGTGPNFWLKAQDNDEALWRRRSELGWRLRVALLQKGKSGAVELAHSELQSQRDPWARTQCLEASVRASTQLRGPDELVLRLLEREPLVSASPLLVAATWLAPRDPGRALGLVQRATALDPRRGRAWALQAELARGLGRAKEAQAALEKAKASDYDF